jgi:hypothetical protein
MKPWGKNNLPFLFVFVRDGMLEPGIEEKPELEWMVQNGHISDVMLTEGLTTTYHSLLFQLAWVLCEDAGLARRAVVDTIRFGVKMRHRYTGEVRLKVWLFHHIHHYIRLHCWKAHLTGLRRRIFNLSENRLGEKDTQLPHGAFCGFDHLPVLSGEVELCVFLYYAADVSILETSFITGIGPEKVFINLESFRQIFRGNQSQVINTICEEVCRLIRAIKDGLFSEKELKDFDSHRFECTYCRSYGEVLVQEELALRGAVQTASSITPMDDLTSPFSSYEEGLVVDAPNKKHILFSPKNIFFSAVATGLIIFMLWYGNQYRIDRASLIPPPITSKQIIIVKITATPTSDISRLERTIPPEPNQVVQNNLLPRPELKEEVLLSNDNVIVDYDRDADYSQDQLYAYSGSMALAAALRFWGWEGKVEDILSSLQPNPYDVTVMPYEILNFTEEAGFKAIYRLGGDDLLLKKILSAGFPVIIQRGFEDPTDTGWMGGYQLLTGFKSSESLIYALNLPVSATAKMSFETINAGWRAFNYAYIIIYPERKEISLIEAIGANSNQAYNASHTAQRASIEIYSNTEVERFFAWFNRGTSLTYLDDYKGAAWAYDEAFKILAGIPRELGVWRVLWYQTRPYWAYYYTGRYDDLVNLAESILDMQEQPFLEESYYWRGLGKAAMGDFRGAREDLEVSVAINPNFTAGREQLSCITDNSSGCW